MSSDTEQIQLSPPPSDLLGRFRVVDIEGCAKPLLMLAAQSCLTPWSCIAYKNDSGAWYQIGSPFELPADIFRDAWEKIVQGHDVQEILDLKSGSAAGRSTPVFLAGVPIADGDLKAGILCVFDAVERHLTAEQRAALTALGALATQVLIHSSVVPPSESETLYKLKKIYENTPVGLIELDEQLNLTAANAAFCKILETDEAALLGRSIVSFTHPDDIEMSRSLSSKIELQGMTKVEKRYITASGKIVYVHVTAKILTTSQGKQSFMSSVEDITHIKEREGLAKALKEELVFEQQKVKQIVDTIHDGLVLHDAEGKVVYFNPAALRVLGVTQDQLLGKSSKDFGWRVVREDGSDITADQHPSAIARREMKHVKGTLLGVMLPSGFTRWLRTSANPFLHSDSNELMVAITFTDVTDTITAQKELEQERVKSLRNAKLAALGEMCAGIAHEINNPLAIILGMTHSLDKYVHDPSMFEKKTESIKKAVGRIAKIVHGLRKFSRSADTSQYRVCFLSSIIDESLTLTDAKSKKYSVQIRVNATKDIKIRCDDLEIEQVLVNLINNSIDAIRTTADPWISLDVFSRSEGTVLQVRDCGRGIDAGIQSRLFQPFFTTKPPGEGTGLGLSIVKGILDEHDASIELITADEHTCFEIRFPNVEIVKDAT